MRALKTLLMLVYLQLPSQLLTRWVDYPPTILKIKICTAEPSVYSFEIPSQCFLISLAVFLSLFHEVIRI